MSGFWDTPLDSILRNLGITTIVPNEDFSELIRSGIRVELDAEDMVVLRRLDSLKFI